MASPRRNAASNLRSPSARIVNYELNSLSPEHCAEIRAFAFATAYAEMALRIVGAT
jgi:hypothetical protein